MLVKGTYFLNDGDIEHSLGHIPLELTFISGSFDISGRWNSDAIPVI